MQQCECDPTNRTAARRIAMAKVAVSLRHYPDLNRKSPAIGPIPIMPTTKMLAQRNSSICIRVCTKPWTAQKNTATAAACKSIPLSSQHRLQRWLLASRVKSSSRSSSMTSLGTACELPRCDKVQARRPGTRVRRASSPVTRQLPDQGLRLIGVIGPTGRRLDRSAIALRCAIDRYLGALSTGVPDER